MRSSYFISPKHPIKVCDIASETIVQLYTNLNELYYSDVFSYILNQKLYLCGWVASMKHFSFDEIKKEILKNIEVDIEIFVNIEQLPILENITKIERGTFLGYSTNENIEGIPFEHLEARNLTKFLYGKINEGIVVQLTINGQEIKICIETNYDDINYIKELVYSYLKNKNYIRILINVNKIQNSILYNSENSFISNTYGPRSPYSNNRFVGLDINRNLKYAHLIAKEVADFYITSRNLNYSLIELTFEKDNPVPIQFGIKGNNTGINIENGTFFELLDAPKYIDDWKIKIETFLKKDNILIEMAKWGYFKYK